MNSDDSWTSSDGADAGGNAAAALGSDAVVRVPTHGVLISDDSVGSARSSPAIESVAGESARHDLDRLAEAWARSPSARATPQRLGHVAADDLRPLRAVAALRRFQLENACILSL